MRWEWAVCAGGPHARTAALMLVLAGLLAGSAGALGEAERLSGPVAARVVEVVDGDTLVVRAAIWLGQEVETRVRLAGIDAPEIRGRCARERRLAGAAKTFVARRLAAGGEASGQVQLTDIRYGKYAGRVLARVRAADGAELGAALVAAGLARPYDGGGRRGWCDVAATE